MKPIAILLRLGNQNLRGHTVEASQIILSAMFNELVGDSGVTYGDINPL